MAGSSVIGALRVQLGLDSAQFSNGLKKSQGALSKFGISAGAAMAGLAAAAATAAVALGAAIKASIDHADELGKTAQKVGVTVEALSRLEYAAKLSDIGLDGLSTGLGKLSQNMLAVANGAGGQVATAFAALGVSVEQADGTLRSSVDVLGSIADRFAGMEDGATKTALAIQIFGKSGKDLIPLLNAGSAGLADMATEADRLGVTISGKTARSAEEFNDNLTRLSAVFEGLVNKITQEALPALVSLTNTLADPSFQNAIVTTTNLFIGLVDVLARTAGLAYELANILPKAVGAGEDAAVHNLPGQEDLIRNALGINDTGGALPNFNDFLHEMGVTGVDDSGGNLPTFESFRTQFSLPPATGGGGASSHLSQQLQDVGKDLDELGPKAETFGDKLGDIFGSLGADVAGLLKGTEDLGSVLLKVAAMAAGSFLPGPGGQFLSSFLGALPGYASGTMGAPGGLAWVGERGKELVNLPRGSQVIPEHNLGEVGGNRLNLTNHIHLDGTMTSRDVVAAVQAGVRQSIDVVKGSFPGWQVEQQTTGGVS